MALANPYLEFFWALPRSFRRDPAAWWYEAELLFPDWWSLKAAIARHFAWAVPTEEAILAIRRYAASVIEIGAGSGYWAWLMRQAGIEVVAFDRDPPPHTWTRVERGDERAVSAHPRRSLFLCWPPWASDMAFDALAGSGGEHVIYVGEWMGGSADARFFTTLAARFEAVEVVAIPQWYGRTDQLIVFRRRSTG